MLYFRVHFWLLTASVCTLEFRTSVADSTKPLESIFENLGYSPTCISGSLASCEQSSKKIYEKNVTDSLATIISLLQELKQDKKRPRHCAEILSMGDYTSGVRTVYPFGCSNSPVKVFCDQSTDGGGWTVFQHRDNFTVREDFARDWKDYVTGFGNLTGEFWLGLENLHALVSWNKMEMRVDLSDYDNNKRWAKYGTFSIGDAISKYALTIGGYSGVAGDGFGGGRHNGRKFTTKDQDNDESPSSCAQLYKGGWWYDNCHISNLNGFQYVGKHPSYADGIDWHPWLGYNYSLKKTSMMIRPVLKM